MNKKNIFIASGVIAAVLAISSVAWYVAKANSEEYTTTYNTNDTSSLSIYSLTVTPFAGYSQITLNGSGFSSIGNADVFFNDSVKSGVTVQSDTELSFNVQQSDINPSELYPIYVQGADSSRNAITSNIIYFRSYDPSEISSAPVNQIDATDPSQLWISSVSAQTTNKGSTYSTTVTINGSGFTSDGPVVMYANGTNHLSGINVVSDNQIVQTYTFGTSTDNHDIQYEYLHTPGATNSGDVLNSNVISFNAADGLWYAIGAQAAATDNANQNATVATSSSIFSSIDSNNVVDGPQQENTTTNTNTDKTSNINTTTPRNFRDNHDGSVEDLSTGITWQQCASGLSGSQCSTGTMDRLLPTDAANTCSAYVSPSDTAGWRLPTLSELESFQGYISANASAVSTYFPNSPLEFFWTGTAYTGSDKSSMPAGSQYIVFNDGTPDLGYNYTNFPFRCVRTAASSYTSTAHTASSTSSNGGGSGGDGVSGSGGTGSGGIGTGGDLGGNSDEGSGGVIDPFYTGPDLEN